MLTFDEIKDQKLTPMMQQYVSVKEQHPDCLIFYRLGDFYEMFFDDALVAAKELELALTGRECGLDKRAPMSGVPHHAADNYIMKLVKRGYKVAIVEQVEDPAEAKGIVKREVVKIVTPGTLTDQGYLDEQKNSFLASILQKEHYYGLAICDITTGLFETSEITYGTTTEKLLDEIAKFKPSEIICNQTFYDTSACKHIEKEYELSLTVQPDSHFDQTTVDNYRHLFVLDQDYSLWAGASSALLRYIEETQFQLPQEINNIKPYNVEQYMILDQTARRNLELTETIRDRKRKGSLLWAIDRTSTAMGARLLRIWVEQPLIDIEDIKFRQNAIAELKENFIDRQELIRLLKNIYDLERLSGRLALGQVNARDLIALISVLEKIEPLKNSLSSFSDPYLKKLFEELTLLPNLLELLKESIVDDPPITITEGGIIKQGFNPQVDEYQNATKYGKDWILNLEQQERDKTIAFQTWWKRENSS